MILRPLPHSFYHAHDPVATRRTNDRKRQADVSEITADVGETHATAKPRIGKTGVKLRFHTKSEYSALTNDQRKELADHRDSREAKGQGRDRCLCRQLLQELHCLSSCCL
jgi:hypothetical protein